MSFRVRYTGGARNDLRRLYQFLLEKDLQAARHARQAIAKGVAFLSDSPFTCRKAAPNTPLLRELIIPFGSSGYVALFDIEDHETVTILAIRHQREDDYF